MAKLSVLFHIFRQNTVESSYYLFTKIIIWYINSNKTVIPNYYLQQTNQYKFVSYLIKIKISIDNLIFLGGFIIIMYECQYHLC